MPTQIATLGGGCFWCTEAVFEQLNGVSRVESGYAGGHVVNPSYEEVCGKKTGHAEVIQVHFDPAVISYRELVEIFLATHDPTTPNRQGHDVGPQYRSVIYTHSDDQATTAKAVIAQFEADKVYGSPIVTEVAPLPNYYPAEAYHQGYYRANPNQSYCAAVAAPKVAKLRKLFAAKLKATA